MKLVYIKINGPEAKGNLKITISGDSINEIDLAELWVAPGAPDVYIGLSRNKNGEIDDSIADFFQYYYDKEETTSSIQKKMNLVDKKTVIVYYKNTMSTSDMEN